MATESYSLVSMFAVTALCLAFLYLLEGYWIVALVAFVCFLIFYAIDGRAAGPRTRFSSARGRPISHYAYRSETSSIFSPKALRLQLSAPDEGGNVPLPVDHGNDFD